MTLEDLRDAYDKAWERIEVLGDEWCYEDAYEAYSFAFDKLSSAVNKFLQEQEK